MKDWFKGVLEEIGENPWIVILVLGIAATLIITTCS